MNSNVFNVNENNNLVWEPQWRKIQANQELYNFVQTRILGECEDGYRRFFWYLKRGFLFDEDENLLIIPKTLLCSLAKGDPNNFSAEQFLKNFCSEIVQKIPNAKFMWREYDPQQKCRMVEIFHLGNLEEEYQRLSAYQPSDARVFISNGTDVTSKKRKIIRGANCSEASHLPACRYAKYLIGELNSLPVRPFSEVVSKYMCEAYTFVESLSGGSKLVQERLLQSIQNDPLPIYFPTEALRTCRIFAGGSIANLKSEVRKIFTQDWHSGDIVSSQIAICAMIWNSTKLIPYLKNRDGDVWQTLMGDLVPAERKGELKKLIKISAFSICYGMGKKKMTEKLAQKLFEKGFDLDVNKIVGHEIFKELLKGARQCMKQIEKNRGMKDAFGDLIKLSADRKVNSIMAQVAQSYEMFVLKPVFDYCKSVKNGEVAVMLYLHDGFYIYIRQNEKTHKAAIKDIVDKELRELNVISNLKWE